MLASSGDAMSPQYNMQKQVGKDLFGLWIPAYFESGFQLRTLKMTGDFATLDLANHHISVQKCHQSDTFSGNNWCAQNREM